MLKNLCSKCCADYTENGYYNDKNDFVDSLYEHGIIEYITEFTGEAIEVNDDGRDNYGFCEAYSGDVIYYVPTRNCSTLFNAAYRNMEEVEHEFQNELGKYFQADIDYKSHLRHIVGTYFG